MTQNEFFKGVYGLVPDAKRHDYTQDYKKKHNDYVDALIYAYACASQTQCFTVHPGIKKVIFNNPATIVYWTDGTKTVVKVGEGEIFDEEKGLAMAISKKFFGNKGNYYNQFKKWLPKDDGVEGVIWADGEKQGCIDKDGKFFTSPTLEKAAKEKKSDPKIVNDLILKCSPDCPFRRKMMERITICSVMDLDIKPNAEQFENYASECGIYKKYRGDK